eukprot:gb/GECH01009065.1/.p1 GENE.gb/GECH01009065.1/~~gb/GECH01009065.1/.p1  ORF type:complete len:102 (+),score=20.67 gb/GECH01009065.1/:1-306(+)
MENEKVLDVALVEDFQYVQESEVAAYYTISFYVAFYRSPADGWDEEYILVQHASAHTMKNSSPNKKIPPIGNIGFTMGISYEYSVDEFSNNVLVANGVKSK